jgi:hypothetical protein
LASRQQYRLTAAQRYDRKNLALQTMQVFKNILKK